MSEYSLFERQETVQSDLGYDYTVVQIEVSVEMDWASFPLVSHITYSVQSEMRALMGNSRSGSALHLDRWVFFSYEEALAASATAAKGAQGDPSPVLPVSQSLAPGELQGSFQELILDQMFFCTQIIKHVPERTVLEVRGGWVGHDSNMVREIGLNVKVFKMKDSSSSCKTTKGKQIFAAAKSAVQKQKFCETIFLKSVLITY